MNRPKSLKLLAALAGVAVLVGVACLGRSSTATPAQPTAEELAPIAVKAATRVALTSAPLEVGARFHVTSRYTIAQLEAGRQIQKTVHDADYEIQVMGIDGEKIVARVTFFRDQILTQEGSRVVQNDQRAVEPLTVETTRENLFLLRTPAGGRALLPAFPQRSVRDGQTWTRTYPMVVANYPVAMEQTLTASTEGDDQAAIALEAHGEAPIGDTGVRLEITASGRSVVDPHACDLPLTLEASYSCKATGGPGHDSESIVTISINTTSTTSRS